MRTKGRVFHRVGKYRSPFEAKLAESMEAAGVSFEYESTKLAYTIPAVNKVYHPDFLLPNGIIVEAKGEFNASDRKKMMLVKEAFPQRDIRIVFYNSNAKIYPGSKTTYAQWCDAHGYQWAHRNIPAEWLKETT